MKQLMIWTLLAVFAAGQGADRAEVQLQAAIKKEAFDGDLKGAIDQYKKLADSSNRAVAAKALVRMGECIEKLYQKLGDSEATKAYERVVREFGDQKDMAEQARARLAALGKPASGPTTRLIGKDLRFVRPSPDGRLLLQSGKDGDLDLRDLQTDQIRHIAKRPWYDAGVSPDGRQIAFLRPTNGTCELRIVGADGSAEHLLWQADRGSVALSLQWFPDGKRIMGTVWEEKDRSRLVAISTSDGAVAMLREGGIGSDAQLSPDGKSVVYTKRARENAAADELWLLRIEDRIEALLFKGQSIVKDPLWTPDGIGVVFLSDRRMPGATLDLWLLRTSGGKPLGFPELIKSGLGEMINGEPTIFASAPITRAGTYYFQRDSNVDMVQLLTTKFDPDTGKIVGTPTFVSPKGGLSRSPSFSADGRWLVYVSQGIRLVIQSIESGEERVVPMTPSPANLDWAVTFPDARSVLVSATHPKDGLGIYRVDAASGAWTSLKKPGESELQGWPNGISPDGRTIYFNRYSHLIARDIETGQERELDSGQGTRVFALSYDGKELAVAHPDGKDLVIDVLPATGGPKREVCRIPGFQQADVAWTPDSRHMIFGPSDRQAFQKNFMRVSLSGGATQPIGISAPQDAQVQFPRAFGALRVHPNGRQLVYVARGKGDDGSEYWVLENFLPKGANQPVR